MSRRTEIKQGRKRKGTTKSDKKPYRRRRKGSKPKKLKKVNKKGKTLTTRAKREGTKDQDFGT
jgi:hypothetical protein